RSRRAKGRLDVHEQLLWNSVNQYVKKDLDSSPRSRKGLTLVFVHPIGCIKEVQPLIWRLLKLPAGRDVEEIWAWEAVDTEDSPLLDEGKLNQMSDWYNSARDFLHFFLHYLTFQVTSDTLPTHLPCVSATEFQQRIDQGFSDRQIVAIGHSFGRNVCAQSCYTYPRLFSALVLADPGIVKRNHPTLKCTITFLAQFGFSQINSWKSRSPSFTPWHPDAFKIYVESSLHSDPQSGKVHLKLHPIYEALANINAKETSEVMYEKLPSLDGRVYIKWVMPDPKKGGG
ncbi:hypothetical protein GYMLUDRAFT_1012519, partial [Collybiopsis luxurians FD-317 M1]